MAEGEIRITEMTESTELSSGDNFVIDNAGTKGTKKFPYTELLKLIPSLITEWQSLVGYPSGYLVTHEGKLYQNKTDSTVIGTEWQGSTVWEEVSLSSILYIIVSNFVHPYSSDGSYRVGDLCIKNYKLYKCKEATTGTWSASKWDEINIIAFLINTVLGNFTTKVIESGGSTFVEKGEIYIINNRMWKAIVDTQTNPLNMNDWESVTVESLLTEAKQQVLEDVGYLVWENTHYYNRGDIVVYGDYLYVCKVDEATYGSFERSDWKKTFVERWGRDLFFDISSQEMTFSDSEYTMPYSKGDVVYRYYPHPSNDGFQMRFYVAKADYPNGVTEYVASQWDEYYSLSEVVDALNKETNKSVDEALAEGTSSGSIATFTDGSTLSMRKLEVSIEPQQDLHGYDAPWVGGSGKNKLLMTVESIKAVNTYHAWSGNSTTINNVTITIETDGNNNVTGIKFNGTASADITFNIASDITIPNGSYVWSNDQIVNISNLWLSLTSPNIAITLSSEKEKNVTVSNGSIGSAYIYASSGNAFNNVIFKPMIRLASVTDATFAPYSNICPISGWTACNVYKSKKNLAYSQTNNTVVAHAKKGVTYTLSFDGTNKGANIRKNTSTGDMVATGANPLTFTADEDFDIFLNAWNSAFSNLQVEVGNQATEYEAYNGNIFNIQFTDGANPLTVYGGTLDVVSGVLTVDRVGVDLSSVSFTYDSNNKRWNRQFSDMKNYSARSADLMFEQYQATTSAYTGNTGTAFAYGKDIYIYDANQSFTISGKCIYELATPQTIQLTPTEVKSLLATNNVFADTGDILDATYVRNANITINDLISRIEALES